MNIKMITGLVLAIGLAVSTMAETVNVSWPENPPAQQVTSYKVECATNSAGTGAIWGVLTNTPGTNVSFSLPQGSVYFFRIKATNLAGDSPPGPTASTPTVPTAPGQPVVTVTP